MLQSPDHQIDNMSIVLVYDNIPHNDFATFPRLYVYCYVYNTAVAAAVDCCC